MKLVIIIFFVSFVPPRMVTRNTKVAGLFSTPDRVSLFLLNLVDEQLPPVGHDVGYLKPFRSTDFPLDVPIPH